jgi:hypothetical protein
MRYSLLCSVQDKEFRFRTDASFTDCYRGKLIREGETLACSCFRLSRFVVRFLRHWGGAILLGWIEMLAVSLRPSMVTCTGTLSPLATPAGTVTSI